MPPESLALQVLQGQLVQPEPRALRGLQGRQALRDRLAMMVRRGQPALLVPLVQQGQLARQAMMEQPIPSPFAIQQLENRAQMLP